MQSAALTKRNPIPLYSLFTANAISLVGNVFTLIAIPWFVLQTTGSATKTGITGFFNILPVIVAGFLGGAIVDRLGYKRTSMISDLASGITTALVPILCYMRGRVFGAITVGAWIAMPFGMLLGGVLTDRLGTFIMMIGMAVTFLITTLSMAFIPAMKEMNRKTELQTPI